MKTRRMIILLGILFAVILIGYSIAPVEGFFLRRNGTRDRKRLHLPPKKLNKK